MRVLTIEEMLLVAGGSGCKGTGGSKPKGSKGSKGSGCKGSKGSKQKGSRGTKGCCCVCPPTPCGVPQ